MRAGSGRGHADAGRIARDASSRGLRAVRARAGARAPDGPGAMSARAPPCGVFGCEVAGDSSAISPSASRARGQQVDEAVPHGREVRGRCGLDGGQTGIGQDHVETAPVIRARFSPDAAAALHAQSGGTGGWVPAQRPAEIARTLPVAGCLRHRYEDGVVSLGEPALQGELSGEVGGEGGPHPLEAAPRPVLALIKPPGFHDGSLVLC